jgi:hypothetical protein
MMELPARDTATDSMRMCGRFMERLALLPLPQWRDIAAGAPAEVDASVAQALAIAMEMADALEVWSLRDDLATVLYRFESAEGRLLLRGHATLPHVRLTTERATYALLVRAALAMTVFDALYGPFAVAISAASL